jgi:hypothetical protein
MSAAFWFIMGGCLGAAVGFWVGWSLGYTAQELEADEEVQR